MRGGGESRAQSAAIRSGGRSDGMGERGGFEGVGRADEGWGTFRGRGLCAWSWGLRMHNLEGVPARSWELRGRIVTSGIAGGILRGYREQGALGCALAARSPGE